MIYCGGLVLFQLLKCPFPIVISINLWSMTGNVKNMVTKPWIEKIVQTHVCIMPGTCFQSAWPPASLLLSKELIRFYYTCQKFFSACNNYRFGNINCCVLDHVFYCQFRWKWLCHFGVSIKLQYCPCCQGHKFYHSFDTEYSVNLVFIVISSEHYIGRLVLNNSKRYPVRQVPNVYKKWTIAWQFICFFAAVFNLRQLRC